MAIDPTTLFPIAWLLTAVVIGAVWTIRLMAIGRARRRRAIVGSTSHPGVIQPAPRLSVVVAARNEEANIEACLRTLLDQDYPDFELIAVDDRSTDQTPDILRRCQAESGGRLRIVTVTQAREGWAGKNNAMREGVSLATGEWFLFTDADCRQTSRRSLSVAMAEALAGKSEFLSIIPILDTPTAWERILQPVCAWVLILWFLPDRANDPSKRTAYANGAFMLMSRRCYETIGGHERVRTELNEDIKMARHAKRAGLTIRVCENEDLYRTRMYRTPREAWNGWSRIFFGSLGTFRRIGISLAMLGVYSLLPWAAWIVSLIAWRTGSGPSVVTWKSASIAWTLVIVLQQMAAWRYYGLIRVGRGWSLTYVLGCVAAFAMLCNAMLKVFGAAGTTWRGTTYRHGQPRPPILGNTSAGPGSPRVSSAEDPSAAVAPIQSP